MQTKTNIEDHVLAIQTYFKEKTLNQDFEVTKIAEDYINCKFDGKYEFSIWIGDYARYCGFWVGGATNCPSSFLPEFTQEEQETLHAICKEIQKEHQAEITLQEIKELEDKKAVLEAKIELLNSKNK